MVIQNVDRCYQVLRRLGGTERSEEFLCRESEAPGKETYLLVCLDDLVLAKQFTLFLEEKIRNREFTDYRECFMEKGAFYAVFRYSLEQSLEEKFLNESAGLKEKTETALGLLKQLLLQNPHPYFAWCGLKKEQMTVSRSLEVHLNYHLEQIAEADTFSMEDVLPRLAEVLAFLFQEELQKKQHPVLEQYLAELREGVFATYLEIYQAAVSVFRSMEEEGGQKHLPDTFWFRLWERTKKVLGFLRRLLMLAILAAAVFYVIWTIRDDSGSRVTQQVMKEIGTLVIEEQEIRNGEER